MGGDAADGAGGGTGFPRIDLASRASLGAVRGRHHDAGARNALQRRKRNRSKTHGHFHHRGRGGMGAANDYPLLHRLETCWGEPHRGPPAPGGRPRATDPDVQCMRNVPREFWTVLAPAKSLEIQGLKVSPDFGFYPATFLTAEK